jgi:hypothetical protein
MRKDGIQTRKRKPKKQQNAGSGSATSEKNHEDLTASGMTRTCRAVTCNINVSTYVLYWLGKEKYDLLTR